MKTRDLYEWANWDTYHAAGAFSTGLIQPLLSNLVVSDPMEPSQVRPDLAERWQIAPDGKTITFFIRRGVKWHDGKDLTAKDVAWNLERALKGEAPIVYNKGRFVSVVGIEVPDDFTVKVNMKQPSPSFLPNIATPFMLMYAPHGPAPSTPEFKSNPFGTGPFKFKSRSSGVKHEWVRNETYYKKDEAGRALPYLDGVTAFVLTDAAAALAAFRTGNIDCGCVFDTDFLTPSSKESLEREIPGVKLSLTNGNRFLLWFNQKAPWTDVRVRKAIFAALDRVLVRDLFRGGKGFYPPTIFLSPDVGGQWGLPTKDMLGAPGFRLKDGMKNHADLEQARELFRQAGVDPKSLTVTYRTTATYRDLGEIVQGALSAIGVKVDLKVDPGGDIKAAFQRGDYDIAPVLGGFSFDDPSDLIPQFFLSTGAQNYANWQRPEVDALYEQVDKELEPLKRQQLAFELQRKILDEGVLSPLAYAPSVLGTQPYVFGYVAAPFNVSSSQRLETIWLKR